jgi:hypothetical protein
MRILFLDDERDAEITVNSYLDDEELYPNKEITQVYNYDQFIDWIEKNGIPDWIFFDHDLGEEKTGMDCAKWLVEKLRKEKKKTPNYFIQSANPCGSANINSLLKCYNKFYNENFR